MSKRLEGKRVLVTGGSRGIGAAIVERLAQEGADIALTYVSNPEAAENTAAIARKHGTRVLVIQADSADPQSVIAAIEHTASTLGGLDILVNNAGVAAWAPIENLSLESFDQVLAVNVRAVFVATQASIKHMPGGGRVINIGSCNAERMPFQGGAAYAMSKSALVGLVKGLARDLGPRGITINNVQPGPVATDMNPEDGELSGFMKAQMALERFSRPEEIAAFVAYLAGDESGFITGASLTIDGGFTA